MHLIDPGGHAPAVGPQQNTHQSLQDQPHETTKLPEMTRQLLGLLTQQGQRLYQRRYFFRLRRRLPPERTDQRLQQSATLRLKLGFGCQHLFQAINPQPVGQQRRTGGVQRTDLLEPYFAIRGRRSGQ